MDANAVEVPLFAVDTPAHHVDRDRALVVVQPQIGRIEIGSPLPEDEIWDHLSGDLMNVVVQEGHEISSGGGGTWDQEELDALISVPGSGSDVTEQGWIVMTNIEAKWTRILVKFGDRRFTQVVIQGVAAIPLDAGVSNLVEVFGLDSDGARAHLKDFSL